MALARRRFIVSLVGVFSGMTGHSRLSAQDLHAVSGQVLDDNDKPIPGVTVTVSRAGSPGISDTTDGDGDYSISFEGGRPIDTLTYRHTGYHKGDVAGLVGSREQRISKTLYPDNTPLDALGAQEVLAAIEREYYASRLLNADLAPLRNIYLSSLEQLVPNLPPGFPELQERRSAVVALWSQTLA